MKSFKCDKCNKAFEEEGELYSADYDICDLLEDFIPSFSIGEVVYEGTSGDLCGKCVVELLVEELRNKIQEKKAVAK
jgi:hypothetical protein